jgi:hypothetical protein
LLAVARIAEPEFPVTDVWKFLPIVDDFLGNRRFHCSDYGRPVDNNTTV